MRDWNLFASSCGIALLIGLLVGTTFGRSQGGDTAREACIAKCECPHKEVAP